MKKLIPFLFVCALPLFAANPPAGFEDAALLKDVMAGKIILKDLVDSNIEFKTVAKAYFYRVTPDHYLGLAVDHPRYSKLFEEVKEGKTTKVSDDKSVFDYWLHLSINVGIFDYDAYPEGRQRLFVADETNPEFRIANEITNYKDQLKFATQNTRLIPWEDGFLVEDTVNAVLVKPSSFSGMIKKELKKFFSKYVTTFRKELKADPRPTR